MICNNLADGTRGAHTFMITVNVLNTLQTVYKLCFSSWGVGYGTTTLYRKITVRRTSHGHLLPPMANFKFYSNEEFLGQVNRSRVTQNERRVRVYVSSPLLLAG
jgi:hypothetical protein